MPAPEPIVCPACGSCSLIVLGPPFYHGRFEPDGSVRRIHDDPPLVAYECADCFQPFVPEEGDEDS